MADATLDTVVNDPVVGIQLTDMKISMGPPRAVSVVFRYELQSGALTDNFSVQLIGDRANAFLQSWMQATPIRKMIQNLREGGELTGFTEV